MCTLGPTLLYLITGASQAEILLKVTSAIALELMNAHDSGKTINLNEIRARHSKRSGYGGVPRLVDIISAVPEDYKKALLPKLKARPIRTASGVNSHPPEFEES
jgi:elongator complex protein 3